MSSQNTVDKLKFSAFIFYMHVTHSVSFGEDIEQATGERPDLAKTHEGRCATVLTWASRHQPCLFGRLGSRGLQAIGINVCWIDEEEIATGDKSVQDNIQRARRRWKVNAAEASAQGFLVKASL